ncbi:MAG: hypothetical protein O3C67_04455 [Cyanobacteria bacterium]|nr:hypothetical protein [Cyanobacteriota bacterium]
MADPSRFQDPHHTLAVFTDDIWVVCPACGGCAHILPQPVGQADGGTPFATQASPQESSQESPQESLKALTPSQNHAPSLNPTTSTRRGLDVFAPRRLICGRCAHHQDWQGDLVRWGDAQDCYFGLPLWLQTAVAGHTLWAYNLRHLSLIEAFVAAPLRSRRPDAAGWHNRSVISRLPRWMQTAQHRPAILRAIARLQQR